MNRKVFKKRGEMSGIDPILYQSISKEGMAEISPFCPIYAVLSMLMTRLKIGARFERVI